MSSHDAKKEAAKQSREVRALKDMFYYRWNEELGAEVEAVTKMVLIDRGYEIFIVVNGVSGDGTPLVAFDSAEDVWTAMVKIARKLRGKGYRWRVDQPRETTSPAAED